MIKRLHNRMTSRHPAGAHTVEPGLRVLVVDDSRSSAVAIARMVAQLESCAVDTCLDPLGALVMCQTQSFDLILVDYMMPGMNGVEFIANIRGLERHALVPIVMVTSELDQKVRHEALDVGATDFLTKPFDKIELLARVRNLLALRRTQLELAGRAQDLARQVEAATRHLAEREEEVIWRLARAIEYRDGVTGDHISRVAEISRLIAVGLGFDEESARIIYLAAPLHDIGKIGIPDAILQKPGRLTDAEMAIMREHVNFGCHVLDGGSSDLVRKAALIAGTHHEKWDGTGYPSGLAGEEIPLEGRIVAIADVFDALCSERPYKRAWPIDEAYAEIVAQCGRHFDPACVQAFIRQWPQIRAVITGDVPQSELLMSA